MRYKWYFQEICFYYTKSNYLTKQLQQAFEGPFSGFSRMPKPSAQKNFQRFAVCTKCVKMVWPHSILLLKSTESFYSAPTSELQISANVDVAMENLMLLQWPQGMQGICSIKFILRLSSTSAAVKKIFVSMYFFTVTIFTTSYITWLAQERVKSDSYLNFNHRKFHKRMESWILFKWNPGLSSHRYSVIFSADSEIFAFSAMFRAVSADFNFYISGHNWFCDEHFWTSLIQRWTLLASRKPTKTIKTAKKDVFFHYWCWKN